LCLPEITIPEEDKNSVFAYNCSVTWYLFNDVLPCYKFFNQQDIFGRIDPQVIVDLNAWMRSNPPKWVMISREETENKDFLNIISEKYSEVTKNERYIIYRLK